MDALSILLWVLAGAGLLSVGSFTNVIIARLPSPLGEPNEFGELWTTNSWRRVLSGTSHCGSCAAPIRAFDNVPVFSFLRLGGRCRNCRHRIPTYHPVVEVAVLVGAVVLVLLLEWSWGLLPLLLAIPPTVAIAVIDVQTLIVPTTLVWPSLLIVVLGSLGVSATFADWSAFRSAALGALLLSTPLFAFWFVLPSGMGFGDVRLSVLLGWLVGWALGAASLTTLMFFVAVVVVIACLLTIALAVSRGPVSRHTKVAFGPGLILSVWLVIAASESLREGLLG